MSIHKKTNPIKIIISDLSLSFSFPDEICQIIKNMFVFIFGACFCTLLIIGWKFLLTSPKPIEQSQNSIESTEDNQQTVRTNIIMKQINLEFTILVNNL